MHTARTWPRSLIGKDVGSSNRSKNRKGLSTRAEPMPPDATGVASPLSPGREGFDSPRRRRPRPLEHALHANHPPVTRDRFTIQMACSLGRGTFIGAIAQEESTGMASRRSGCESPSLHRSKHSGPYFNGRMSGLHPDDASSNLAGLHHVDLHVPHSRASSNGRTAAFQADNASSSLASRSSRPHRLAGLGHRPFTPTTRVQIPLGSLFSRTMRRLWCRSIF